MQRLRAAGFGRLRKCDFGVGLTCSCNIVPLRVCGHAAVGRHRFGRTLGGGGGGGRVRAVGSRFAGMARRARSEIRCSVIAVWPDPTQRRHSRRCCLRQLPFAPCLMDGYWSAARCQVRRPDSGCHDCWTTAQLMRASVAMARQSCILKRDGRRVRGSIVCDCRATDRGGRQPAGGPRCGVGVQWGWCDRPIVRRPEHAGQGDADRVGELSSLPTCSLTPCTASTCRSMTA